MRLVIFDVDGTLTQTTAIDAHCFRQACTDLYGLTDIDCDWTHYVHPTDPGILREIFEFRSGRRLIPDELARFRKYFLGLVHAAAQKTPFNPVLGAPELLVQLSREDHSRVALASGCWADSARIKMRSAGMRYDEYFSASADDDESREGIIRIAIERVCCGVRQSPESVVYVGDGLWDARACSRLGISFIGVGAGAHREKLFAAGAVDVVPDFSSTEQFFAALHRCK